VTARVVLIPPDTAIEDEHPGLAVSGRQETRLEVLELQKALDMLSSEHREVLLLVAVEGLKYEEAADVLRLPVGTVRSRLSRARTSLRELLDWAVPDERSGAP
jgi:RNA polymerase sigma-70 factor (ECF subfamily)